MAQVTLTLSVIPCSLRQNLMRGDRPDSHLCLSTPLSIPLAILLHLHSLERRRLRQTRTVAGTCDNYIGHDQDYPIIIAYHDIQ